MIIKNFTYLPVSHKKVWFRCLNSVTHHFFSDHIEGAILKDVHGLAETSPEIYILNGGFKRPVNTNVLSSYVLLIFI